MIHKNVEKIECISCGYCCGYNRSSYFGGCSYDQTEKIPKGVITNADGLIPVDDNDVCIYLQVLDNGFTRCKIHNRKPRMCKLYYCLMEQKIKSLETIIKYINKKSKTRHSLSHIVKEL